MSDPLNGKDMPISTNRRPPTHELARSNLKYRKSARDSIRMHMKKDCAVKES